jgi:Protein of unknown function (DUF4235)
MILAKVLYWPIGLVGGIVGARLAGRVFERTWELMGHEGDPPKPKVQGQGWVEIMAASAVKGAVFGGVKALVDHASATGFARVTGVWPGAQASADAHPSAHTSASTGRSRLKHRLARKHD